MYDVYINTECLFHNKFASTQISYRKKNVHHKLGDAIINIDF